MDKYTMVYSHDGILLNIKREQTMDMGQSLKHYTEEKALQKSIYSMIS